MKKKGLCYQRTNIVFNKTLLVILLPLESSCQDETVGKRIIMAMQMNKNEVENLIDNYIKFKEMVICSAFISDLLAWKAILCVTVGILDEGEDTHG